LQVRPQWGAPLSAAVVQCSSEGGPREGQPLRAGKPPAGGRPQACGLYWRQGRHESGAWPINTHILRPSRARLNMMIRANCLWPGFAARPLPTFGSDSAITLLCCPSFSLCNPLLVSPPLPIVPHSCCPAPFVTLMTYGYGCAGCCGRGCAGRGGGGVGTESGGGGNISDV